MWVDDSYREHSCGVDRSRADVTRRKEGKP